MGRTIENICLFILNWFFWTINHKYFRILLLMVRNRILWKYIQVWEKNLKNLKSVRRIFIVLNA